jgi:cyclophilin family peptidyl-prolyl cis-trans isomerase
MPSWFRRAPRPRRAVRPAVQELEDRRLLTAPAIDPVQVPLNVPIGKTLIVPLSAADPAGGSVSWSVTSSNPNVTVTPHTGNTFLELNVQNFGTMEFELFDDLAPATAALIGGMVQGEFYNGLTFHRVVNGFMIQGGDPAGNGTGGPGFTFDDEFNPNAIFSGSGQLALANSGKDTNGSQFFITDGPQRFLDFNHTIFGQLVRGFNVLHAIEATPVTLQDPTNPNSEVSKPVTPVVITSAAIVQDTTDAVFTLTSTGTTTDTTTLTVKATASTGGSTTEQLQAQVVADVDSQGQPVNDPPILGPVSDQVSPTGAPVVVHLTRTDLENDASDYGAAVLQADSANATVSTPVVNADGSADVTVTPTAGFTGAVHAIVGVKEHGATSRGSTSYPWDTQVITVAFGDQPLTAQPGTAIAAAEGAPATAVPVAAFTDADLLSAGSDFRVSINWGDGTPPDTTSGTVVGSNGTYQVLGTHQYREAGTYPVRVVVTDASGGTRDNGGATMTVTNTATVADAGLSSQGVAVAAAGPVSAAPVATFTDADPGARAGDFVAQITWGDGTTSAGTVVAAGNGFQVLGSHAYAATGQYAVKVAIADVNTAGTVAAATSTAATTAVITAPPPPPTPQPIPTPQPPQPPGHGRHHHRRHHLLPHHAKHPRKKHHL